MKNLKDTFKTRHECWRENIADLLGNNDDANDTEFASSNCIRALHHAMSDDAHCENDDVRLANYLFMTIEEMQLAKPNASRAELAELRQNWAAELLSENF